MVNTGKDHTSTISTSANFDATCTYPAKCNQPNWTIDGRGNETNYTYNTTTGQVLSIVQPAGANGLRPETDLTYTNQYAWYKYLDGGSVAQSPSAVSLLTKISQCATAQTCAGTANALESTFTYGLSGVANNLLLTSTTQGAGDGSLVATTQLTYDSVSNLYTVTDPLLRATRYRFDTVRQLVGVVGPDPDGAGPLHNRAVRITYECDSSIKSGCDGLVTKIEQGTVLSEADSDWPAFATLGQRAITYDGIDRKSTDILSSGSTYIAASQFSYDAANRLTCQTQRMNPNALTSLPAACSLGTQGSAGPDRITYLTYDNSPVNGADPLGLWDGTCATFILPDPGPTSAGFPELDIPITSTGYSPHTLCSGGGSDIGQATGGGSSTSPAQSPQPFNLKNWLCMKGNALASGADLLGSASAKLEMGGVAIGIVGAVTAQPEVAGVGVAVAATGGFGSIGAGALQFGAGLLQGFGGRGFGNSISALATLGASATVGRFFAGPAVNGYRTVSQRTTDSFLQNSAITTGGIFDTLTSFLEQLGPQQVSCP